MDRKIIVSLIVVIIIVFLSGIYFGAIFSKQKVNPQQINALNSKVITSINAYGKVSSIMGKNVTLVSGASSTTIAIKDGATINLLSRDKTKTAGYKKASFADIKTGYTLNASLSVLPDGTFQANSVIIIPSK